MLSNYIKPSALENFLFLLSEAVDLGTGNLAHHQIRTAYISFEIANKLRLNRRDVNEITISSLFHDIGALSVDDNLLDSLKEFKGDDPHCKVGEIILRDFPFLIKGPIYVRYHHTPYDKLLELGVEAKYHTGAQIIFLSDYIERQIRKYNIDCLLYFKGVILNRVTELLSMGKVNKDIFEAFIEVSQKESFWFNLRSPSVLQFLLQEGEFLGVKNNVRLSDILTFIVNVVDIKSNYTIAHSSGVSVASRNIGIVMGLDVDDVEKLQLAGYLHDIGKIAAPSRILNKKGKLTREEYLIIQRHPYYTYRLLNAIDELKSFVFAAFHHENEKGTGYPFGLSGKDLDKFSRIVNAADLFTALYEDRPYRKRMSDKTIKEIFQQRASEGLMKKSIAKRVINHFGEIALAIREEQEKIREWYSSRFGSLL